MKLYDIMNLSKGDYDTYDVVYDAEVTVCYIGKEKDNYDKFCNGIIKKVDVERIVPEHHITVNWSKLITDNMEKFKRFSREYWAYDYEDDEDEFIYQWINEIHLYMAGYVDEDFYKILVDFVETLEG